MKKNSLGFIFILLFGLSGCQPEVPSSQLVYVKIIKHKKTKEEAFELSKMWLANSFNDSKAVIEYTNKKDGTIIGKGIFRNVDYGMTSIDTRFTLKIDIKNEKSRLSFKNMLMIPNASSGIQKFNMWNMDQLKNFKVRANELVGDYNNSIYQLNINSKSDW